MCIMFLVKILKMTLIITLMITVDFRSSVTLDSVERAAGRVGGSQATVRCQLWSS